jgi:hypothetical protein
MEEFATQEIFLKQLLPVLCDVRITLQVLKNLRRNYYFEGRKFKSYRGMGSVSNGRWFKDRYFQDVEDDVKKLVPRNCRSRTLQRRIKRKYASHWRSSCRNGILVLKTSQLYRKRTFCSYQQVVSTKVTRIM